ncbi:hypothetical protein [Longitalea arenae]|uniref:hypothetical protein n=1 Tax=Longitalea arenae TaxID=2812558 RepID=UPI0019686C4E|nr:hypothetical protein [Longitalea arenae]
MPPSHRVPANSLVLTIIIALVLAILCSSVIVLAYYSRQHQITATIDQRLNRNLESAMNLVLEGSGGWADETIDTLDLFDQQADSVTIKKRYWGVFEVACITAFSNVFSKNKAFISGTALPAYMDGCLYLADHRRPLAVNGNTVLTGDVYLSKGGIKPIYINQRAYSGSSLVNGKIKTSEEALPRLDASIIDHLYKMTKDSVLAMELPAADSLVRAFDDSTTCMYSKDIWQLAGMTIKGHVMIKADSLIEADASTHLEDVILIAPVIRFKKGFTGTVQAIATDSLIAEAGSVFNYPSALVLLKEPGLKMQNVMRMEEGCNFQGLIIASCDPADVIKSRVEIKKNTLINGVVYVMGYCALGGQVNGSVLADFFIYQEQNIMYENTLVDVNLSRGELSPYFIGSPVFHQATRKQIIKWVK